MQNAEPLNENIEDVQVIYPKAIIKIVTVIIVDEKPVLCEAAELVDLAEDGDAGIFRMFRDLLPNFRVYLKKIKATRLTPDVLKNIRDNYDQAAPSNGATVPSSMLQAQDPAQGTGLPSSREDLPDTASASARTPEAGTEQES